MSKKIPMKGERFSIDQFRDRVSKMTWAGSFKPSLVTIHHTAAPSMAQRPSGWTAQHMKNLANHYHNVLGWSVGPHLFTDEHAVWELFPMEGRSNHAVSFNSNSLSIEMLGQFDSEDPTSGRGLKIVELTAHATAILLRKLGKSTEAVRFHRDCPRTTKSCPGRKVDKAKFLRQVQKWISVEENMGNTPPPKPNRPQGDAQPVVENKGFFGWFFNLFRR